MEVTALCGSNTRLLLAWAIGFFLGRRLEGDLATAGCYHYHKDPHTISLYMFIYPECIERLSLGLESDESEPEMEILHFNLSDLLSLGIPDSPYQPSDDISQHAKDLLYRLTNHKAFALRFSRVSYLGVIYMLSVQQLRRAN